MSRGIVIVGLFVLTSSTGWTQEVSITRTVQPMKNPVSKKNNALTTIKNPLLLRIQKDRTESLGDSSMRKKRINPKRSLTHAASR